MAKWKYQIEMRHDEDSLVALAHMQYDLFCVRNRVARSFLSLALIVAGVLTSAWWGLLLVGYGCYLTTTTYAASNRTAHRLAAQLREAGMDLPYSTYYFENNAMHILVHPEEEETDPLRYADVLKLGEDGKAYYLFRNEYGGYRIPKQELGEKEDEFRRFVEERTGKMFQHGASPLNRLRARLRARRARR